MPRIVRDSDEDVEIKTTTRRTTRAAAAASVTDSPVRRTTRNKKPLSITDSSPEIVEENVQPNSRSTRSRTTTLDKQTAATTLKTLRSRKVSGSSDLSESLDIEIDSLPKRVTRKQASGTSATNTPTKVNSKTRSIRASSEAKSTPPVSSTRNKRLTRASSVDLNESSGTPVKRRTRASMIPIEPTVTEEQEFKNKAYRSLENTVMEIDEDDYETTKSSKKEKSKNKSHIEEVEDKDSSNAKEPLNDSGKSSLDSYSANTKVEEGMINKSSVSNDVHEESTLHSIDTGLGSALSMLTSNLTNNEPINTESSVLSKQENIVTKENDVSIQSKIELDCSNNQSEILKINPHDGDGSEIDVEELTESVVSDASISVVDSPEKSKNNFDANYSNLEIKDSYVKLARTDIVEKILNEKLDECQINETKENQMNIKDEKIESNTINSKTAIVLISDFVKDNESNLNNFIEQDKITSLDNQQLPSENSETHTDLLNSNVNTNDKLNTVPVNCDTSNILNYVDKNNLSIKNVTSAEEVSEMEVSDAQDTNDKLSTTISNDNFTQTNNSDLNAKESNDKMDDSNFVNKSTKNEFTNIPNDTLKNSIITNNSDNETHNLIVNKGIDKDNLLKVDVIGNEPYISAPLVETNDTLSMNESSNNIERNIDVKKSSREPMDNLSSADVGEKDIENFNGVNVCDEIKISNVKVDDLFVNNKVEEPCNVAYVDSNKPTNLVSHDTTGIEIKNLEAVSENERIVENELITDQTSESANKNDLTNENDGKDTLEKMEINTIDSDGNDNVDNVINISDNSDSDCNDIELKLIEVDNNSVSSAVTDAVDDNIASSPKKKSQSKKLDESSSSPNKSLKKNNAEKIKSKNKIDDSDSDDNIDGLFQDILADEWTSDQPQNKSIHAENAQISDEEVKDAHESIAVEKTPKKDRKSSESKRLSKSNEITCVNESLSKKTRKSLEKSQSSPVTVSESLELKNNSGSQDSEKTLVESDVNDDETDENKSPNKSRRSLNKSARLNESKTNKHSKSAHNESNLELEYIEDKNVENKSPNKSRRSQLKLANTDENKIALNDSIAFKRKSIADTSRKSLAEEQPENDESVVEMEIDKDSKSEQIHEKSLNKSRKSLNASQLSRSNVHEESAAEKLMNCVKGPNLFKYNELPAGQIKNLSKTDKLSVSLIESKKLKNKESEKRSSLPDSKFLKSPSKSVIDESTSDEEMEVKVESIKSLNKSKQLNVSINNKSFKNDQIVSNAEAEVSFKDKSLKETSLRKSLNKSVNAFKAILDDLSEDEEKEKIKTTKSPNTSVKSTISLKSTKKSQDHELESDLDPANIKEIDVNEKSYLDKSLQKSIERMKFANPSKLDYSIVAQFDSSEDESSSVKIPSFIFKSSDASNASDDEEDDEENDDDEDDDDEMDSDIAREYNLSGKKIKYEDDDVQGDTCRASEEESSDPDDDGEDLDDFVVPDDDVESDEDQDDDEDDDDDEENEDDEDDDVSNEVEDANEVNDNVSKSKKDLSANTSKLSVKNMSKLRFSEDSSSESDDEVASKNNIKNKSKNDSNLLKDKSINLSQSIKEQSANSSRLLQPAENSSSDSEDEEIDVDTTKDKSVNSKSTKDKSINSSKSVKNTSVNLSKSIKEKSMNLSKSIKDKTINDSNLNKSKNTSARVSFVEKDESSSEYETEETANKSKLKKVVPEIASPSESESENGEDSYHVMTVDYQNESTKQAKNKKRNLLIECSTPKPGLTKKVDFCKNTTSFLDKDSLLTTVNKSSRKKSDSFTDLTNTKNLSSRMSIGDVASKSVIEDSKAHNSSVKVKGDVTISDEAPEALKNRQMWKLIPLSQTIPAPGEETPKTKFLKKSKLNDSVPVLESMKSGDLPTAEASKKDKSKKSKNTSLPLNATVYETLKDVVPIIIDATEHVSSPPTKKSKKRKLQDMSNVPSIDDDSMIAKVKKNKKRPRVEEAEVEDDQNEEHVKETVEKTKKKKKNNKNEEVEQEVVEHNEEKSSEKKKKKKNKVQEVEIEEEVEQVAEEKQKKKKKKKAQEDFEEEPEVEVEKSKKKKKSKVISEVEDVEKPQPVAKKLKKNSKQPAEDSDDEAPEVLDFSLARRVAVKAMETAAQAVKEYKEAHKKKQKEKADRKSDETAKMKKNLKRLPDDFLDNLADDPVRRPQKRQKLTQNTERKVMVVPSTSMFSPGKTVPANLEVDDCYTPLSSAGGTTQFGVIPLTKVKKAVKTNAVVMNFRQKMLARNKREPTAKYLAYVKTMKAKGGA